MSNQIYIPPINFNENENLNSSTVSINAIEPLEYNKVNSNLSIKAATENNYGVLTTGDQNIRGNKNFINGLISEDAVFINLEITNGTITTEPTNNIDITNKGYVDTKATSLADEIKNKTTDLVKYNTSTKYLIDNKTNSNINDLKINNLSVNNQINGSSVSVKVSTTGYYGTETKTISVYKAYVNGLTCIIFNKNTEINSHHWVSDIEINENGMVMDFSNFSDIYSNLPQMFELKGEASTYGGSKNVATKTLKFVKSSGYKYTVQYDKSFPMNLFKLKESIKNTDTYIFTSETNKIGTLTIDKGYLYNTPTESNNIVNKSYVDNKTIAITEEFKKKDNEIITSLNSNVSLINDHINSIKSELNGNIENSKTELNGNIESAKTELNGKIDNAKSELNAKINSSINGIKNVDLTTGTISTTPTNNTDISNKKYVDDSINSLKSYSDSNFIKYDSGSNKLIKSSSNASQQINNLSLNNLTSENSTLTNSTIDTLTCTTSTINNSTSTNSTVDNVQINNKITINTNIMDLQSYGMCPIENSSGSVLKLGVMYFLKIKVNNTIYLNIRLRFEPFVSDGSTLYIKNVEFSDIGSGFQDYINYHCVINATYKFGRCVFNVSKNSEGKYDVEISGTVDGDNIYKIDDFTCVYYLAET